MTIVLVVAMVVALATAQWYFVWQRKRAAERARNAVRYVELDPGARPADDVLFHPGHSWAQVHGGGLASVGATAFAANFAGELERVELPAEGRRFRQAEPALTLVSKGGRRLDLAIPLGGQVLAVNPEVRRDPSVLQRRPYDVGWILRVRPSRLSGALRNLLPLRAAQSWVDDARSAVTARLAKVSSVPAFDGGHWSTAFGDLLRDEDWVELRRDLFPTLPERDTRER